MIKVLVTGAGGGVGQGIVKALRLIDDLDIEIFTADMSPIAAGLYGGDYSYLVPAASDPCYFDAIENICNKNNIDFYFPGTDVELLVCAHSSEEMEKKLGVKTLVSPLSVIEIADDKLKTVNFLKDNGLSYPTTWLPEEVDLESLTYPVIVKPRIGCRSIGVYVVHTAKEAKRAIESLDGPIIQEYIDGEEYTCTVAIVDSNISDVLCLKRDLRAGDTFRAYPESNLAIESYVKEIAQKIGIKGSCNFQLRLTNGVPKLFEINSRFSGTTPFCAYLGFNPVEFCLKSQLGISYKSTISYDKVVVRHWTEVVLNKTDIDSLASNREGKLSAYSVSSML
ncbi:ATP-grasp domain-containing protein [Photobacterium sanguinicancri]|uniref:ATP-grasp domain-containing protein n=1 Tax=Photobacterium sanguinicancri TaxID=875932 RepID=UPI0021C256EF|nr:ATP-grasp domain-containing protein [Photobacterium sanguinicancri]